MTNFEAKKKEAIARMKEWKLFPEVINQFKKDGLVNASVAPFGACYWLNEEQKKRVHDFEEEHDALVYHVIHSMTEFGEIENFLFVGNGEEEWPIDHEDLKEGMQLVYAYNVTDPWCSDMGTIGVTRTVAAGLKRTW